MSDPLASAKAVGQLVREYLQVSERVAWRRFEDMNWEQLAESKVADQVTPIQVAAIKTAMLVEDHIPDYGKEYLRILPVSDPENTDAVAWENRQLTRFVYRWTAEEERHGWCLEEYLRAGELVDEDELTAEMIREGKRPYQAPHDDPLQLFTYTVIQEKATQLFYHYVGKAIDEPVLNSVLSQLAKDESRHAAFFADLVRLKLDQTSDPRVGAKLKEAVQAFQMPLSNIITNYKRLSIVQLRAAPGYKLTQAFDYLERVLNKYVSSRTGSVLHDLSDVLRLLAAIEPGRPLPSSA